MLNNILRLRVLKIIETAKLKVKPTKTKVEEKVVDEVKEIVKPEVKLKAKPKTKTKVKPVVEEGSKNNAKTVYVYKGKKCVGEYDSVTKCGAALGMSRLMVRKAIGSGEELDNGLILTFTNK